MVDDPIPLEKMDELLQFLPLFDVPGRSYVLTPDSSGARSDGDIPPPYPEYCEDVLAFFWMAGQPGWSDFEYDPRQAQALVGDDAFIRSCSLDEFKTLLTYCVRSERFADGAWLSLLESGRIVTLLRRLAVLRDSLQPAA